MILDKRRKAINHVVYMNRPIIIGKLSIDGRELITIRLKRI
jgi:hypothetical protein